METHTTDTSVENSNAQVSGTSKGALNRFALWRMKSKNKEGSAAERRHKRHACSAIGTMSILDRSISMDGIVLEIACGGIKFRPAKAYLLDRKGDQVSITFGDFQVSGKIVAVRNDGYGIALFNELNEDHIKSFMETYSA